MNGRSPLIATLVALVLAAAGIGDPNTVTAVKITIAAAGALVVAVHTVAHLLAGVSRNRAGVQVVAAKQATTITQLAMTSPLPGVLTHAMAAAVYHPPPPLTRAAAATPATPATVTPWVDPLADGHE